MKNVFQPSPLIRTFLQLETEDQCTNVKCGNCFHVVLSIFSHPDATHDGSICARNVSTIICVHGGEIWSKKSNIQRNKNIAKPGLFCGVFLITGSNIENIAGFFNSF